MKSVSVIALMAAVVGLAGCEAKQDEKKVAAAPPKLGIRPNGDETIKPDLSKVSPEMLKVFQNIDQNIDSHVEAIRTFIRQPSISNSGEGIAETAEMVKGYFDKLGCQQTQVYDVGLTEYGTPGNPVVYAKCDNGAPKTLVIYWMYDTMPVTQPENWVAPPFEARIVDGKTAGIDPAVKKVLIGRGAINTKGPAMIGYNALTAMKESLGKLPVNLIFIAEGDEERMDIGLRKFMSEHSDLFKGADAMLGPGGSEGCVYIELTTSGKSWGRGPVQSDIHGSNKRSVDSPAWRHIQMLSSLVSEDGNTPKIKGFADDLVPLSAEELASLQARASKMDLKTAAKNLGVARFMSEDTMKVLTLQRYGLSFNLDGIWGGNMYAGGAGAILPNKITSKHNIRYVPNMKGPDIVKKIRAQLDANGYKDVELKLIGDVPWSKVRYDTDIQRAADAATRTFGQPVNPRIDSASILGGYWPSYLFSDQEVGEKVGTVTLPIGGGGFGGASGNGGRAHAADEYLVIEGAGKTPGVATAEKNFALMIWNYANGIKDVAPPPAPPAPAAKKDVAIAGRASAKS